MYSKYEEMCVIKQVIKNYAENKKRQYESTISMLRDQTNSFPLDINSERANSEISSLQNHVSLLSDYRTDYATGMSIFGELNKATMCYEQAYTPDQLQPGGIAEQRTKEGNKIFHDLRTQNVGYKKVIDEIAYSLFVAHDPHLDGLSAGLESKLDSLDKEFEQGSLSKEELIFYSNMCNSLSKNPDYIDYMSQFQQETSTQGFHR